MHSTILVLSKKTSMAALIARTLRYRQVYCVPMPFTTSAQDAMALSPNGIIIAASDDATAALAGLDDALLDGSVPILALGAAAVALCVRLGGEAGAPACARGAVTLGLEKLPLFEEITTGEHVLHGLSDLTLPATLLPIATATERVIGFRHQMLPLYALQYPIERNDPDAAQLLFNFATAVCGCRDSWDDDAIIANAVNRIRSAAPEGHLLCAVSGGVDSAVCARLASLAVGDRLICVFVDTGLFRRDEPDEVIRRFMDNMGLVVAHVDARDAFLHALSGVSSAGDKERIASQLMTQVLLKQLSFDPELRAVVMGTNFNDTLYGFSPSAGIDVASRGLDVVEPVRNLFKDEVRRLATTLRLPDAVAGRQPFPASGLALRVMGSVTPERLDMLRAADACFTEEMRAGGHEKRLWQYYATLMEAPNQPTGYAICLRALQAAQDTAHAARLPFDLLERATQRIRDEVPGISRVVYDLTPSAHYGEME